MSSILALSTALPPYRFFQREVADLFIQMFSLEGDKAASLKKLYENSNIETRFSVVPDFTKERSSFNFLSSDYPKKRPGTNLRNQIYKREAPKLAYEAALKALESWGEDPKRITHVVFVSCTGMVAPGIEFDLMKRLQLNPTVNRFGINFMGCFGAFKGLSLADSFVKENPHHRVLVVCTELCSLHIQADQTLDNMLANSLFSDGAAAVVVGADVRDSKKPLWRICKKGSFGLEGTEDKMSWEATDEGFVMQLSHTVPVLLARQIEPFVTSQLMESHSIEECEFAVHPGGKSILQATEKALKLKEKTMKASWNTLAKFGNMSSATFLFVLKELLEEENKKRWTLGLGFGPGLSIEGLLLERCS